MSMRKLFLGSKDSESIFGQHRGGNMRYRAYGERYEPCESGELNSRHRIFNFYQQRSGRFGATTFARILALALFLCVFSLPALAQVDQGGIVGTVSDTQGRVVPGATVKLTETNTEFCR